MTLSPSTIVKCPVCQTPCSEPPLYRYTVSRAAAHFCPITRSPERYHRLEDSIRKLWQGEECAILQCQECGFGFGYPFVGGDEDFYSILHEQKGYPTWRWDYDIALQEALIHSVGGKILEVGAGAGVFLSSLGQEWHCYATEGSESNRKELEDAGVIIFRDLEAASQDRAGFFDVIVMFQVLEHIAEFQTLLTQCRRLLRDGGKLAIVVPDGAAMIRQEKITGCPDMPPNHINKWTEESLSRALKAASFNPRPAIYAPSSWQSFKDALHLRVSADAINPRSLAAQVYRIPNKSVRVPLLACLGLPALLRMLPHATELRQGGSFATIAEAA